MLQYIFRNKANQHIFIYQNVELVFFFFFKVIIKFYVSAKITFENSPKNLITRNNEDAALGI